MTLFYRTPLVSAQQWGDRPDHNLHSQKCKIFILRGLAGALFDAYLDIQGDDANDRTWVQPLLTKETQKLESSLAQMDVKVTERLASATKN